MLPSYGTHDCAAWGIQVTRKGCIQRRFIASKASESAEKNTYKIGRIECDFRVVDRLNTLSLIPSMRVHKHTVACVKCKLKLPGRVDSTWPSQIIDFIGSPNAQRMTLSWGVPSSWICKPEVMITKSQMEQKCLNFEGESCNTANNRPDFEQDGYKWHKLLKEKEIAASFSRFSVATGFLNRVKVRIKYGLQNLRSS